MDDNSKISFENISDDEWKKILLDLKKYSNYKCKFLPPDIEPEDIVIDALTKVLDGSRKWNKEKYPDLKNFFFSVINSIYSKIWQKEYNSKRFRETKDITCSGIMDEISDTKPFDTFENDFYKEKLELIRKAINGDEELEYYFIALEDGKIKSSDIAEYLQWDIKKVYNVKRKFKRHVIKYIEDNERGDLYGQ